MATETVWSQGKLATLSLGKCIDFDASNERVSFTVPASMDPANMPEFSVSVWFYPRGYTGSIFANNPSVGGQGFNIAFTSGRLRVQRAQSGGANADATILAGQIKFAQWNHLLFTFSDTTSNFATIYLNGVLAKTTTISKGGTTANWSGNTATLGNKSDSSDPFNGRIDDFRVWRRILTAAEVRNTYLRLDPPTGCLIHYPMNETSGSVVDFGTAGVNATVTNATQNIDSYSYQRSQTVEI